MRLVPQYRLIAAVALLLVPLTLAIPFAPAAAAAAAAVAVLLSAAVLIDAGHGPRRLRGLELRLPATVRATQGRPAELDVQVAGAEIAGLRIGIHFPPQLAAEAVQAVQLPAGGGEAFFRWPFQPQEQGRFRLGGCVLEIPSRWGLWSLRRHLDLPAEVRVYPNLVRERHALPALFTRAGDGAHLQRMVGKGRDFEKLREYVPGDCFEDIHWKATARRSRPVTKIFQMERTQRVYAVIDTSRLSLRPLPVPPDPAAGNSGPPISETVSERFGTAALTLALAAQQQGDTFGLAAFDDNLRLFIPAQTGPVHFGHVRDALHTLKARGVSPDFGEVFADLANRLRRRALVIILTQLEDPVLVESFLRDVEIIRRRHLVVAAMLRPPPVAELFAQADVAAAEQLYERLAGHLLWRRLRETEHALQRRRIGFALVHTDRLCAELVGRYITLKRRQLI
jgi:uncharacterized protein (DUF58 family)